MIVCGQNINAQNYGINYKYMPDIGDTINRFDIEKRKTGYWIEHLFREKYEFDTSFWYIDKGYYEKGQRVGLWQAYYTGTNSLYLQVFYVGTEQESTSLVSYYPNGNREFSDERSESYGYILNKRYWKNGRIETVNYHDSILFQMCNYNIHGDIEVCVEELLSTDENLIVTRTYYFASGTIKSIEQLRGVPDSSLREYESNGICREYNEDSKLIKVQNFKSGKLNGSVIKFSDEGEILWMEFYKDGVMIWNKIFPADLK